MQPSDVQVIGDQLAIKWRDGTEAFLDLQTLRRRCPCASCQGERDVMGKLHKGPSPRLTQASFQLLRLENVGTYAIQPVWGDGHNTGLYSFDYLRSIAS